MLVIGILGIIKCIVRHTTSLVVVLEVCKFRWTSDDL